MAATIRIALICCVAAGIASALPAGNVGQQQQPQQWAFAGLPAMPNFGLPLPFFPGFPIQLPSPADIANMKPAPGENFVGMVSSSNSGYTRDKDGNLVRTGGVSMLSNIDGKTETFQAGDAPPALTNSPVIGSPNFPYPAQFIPFPVAFFSNAVLPPFDTEALKNYKPKENEHFYGAVHSSVLSSSDIDGKTSVSGREDTIINDDGVVTERSVIIGDNGVNEEATAVRKELQAKEEKNKDNTFRYLV